MRRERVEESNRSDGTESVPKKVPKLKIVEGNKAKEILNKATQHLKKNKSSDTSSCTDSEEDAASSSSESIISESELYEEYNENEKSDTDSDSCSN